MNKIAFYGVHGAGKTTAANELYDRLIDAGRTVYLADEPARRCPHTLRTIEAQEWIWDETLAQEKHGTLQDVDVVICDRLLIDNLMYYKDVLNTMYITHEQSLRWWKLYCEAVSWMPSYDWAIRMPLNLEWLQEDDPIRPTDEEYARRIDGLFNRYINPFVTNTGVLYLDRGIIQRTVCPADNRGGAIWA